MTPSPAHADLPPGQAFTPMPGMNPSFADAGRKVTPEEINSRYNNFYEFGSQKAIYDAAQALPTEPWTIEVDGMVNKPFKIGIEDLLKKLPPEERIYRHRCVEAWSMVIPWIGIPLKRFVAMAEPTSGAKYVRFQSFEDPKVARGQRQVWYPWPYIEGMTIEEANNEMPLMVVGAYGKILLKQFGAPIRVHMPWKYGFKSAKSLVKISFTDKRPVSFWETLASNEYGFWANVNPKVPHPRWSQATERVLGTGQEIPTVIFNGYGDEVASLYKGMEAKFGDTLYR